MVYLLPKLYKRSTINQVHRNHIHVSKYHRATECEKIKQSSRRVNSYQYHLA